MNRSTLTMTADFHRRLRTHLFPGDGLEAAAILVCSRTPPPRHRLLVRDIILVPHEACPVRKTDRLVWPGEYLEKGIDAGEADGLSVILMHSHPSSMLSFSDEDDASDQVALSSLQHAYLASHGSAVMAADGRMVARTYGKDMVPQDIDLISVIGDDLCFHFRELQETRRGTRPTAFTSAMTAELNLLSCAVIGTSGIGSIVAEQLARLGFGSVTLIDDDIVEIKNLNRILNSTAAHATAKALKTTVLADAFRTHGRGDYVDVPLSIIGRDAVIAASQADILFCCVDSLDGRQIADLLSSHFLMPLFDVGVTIPTRKVPDGIAIAEVCGRIDYVFPGGSNLRDRGVYDDESLRIEQVRRNAPESYDAQVATGYIKGAVEEAPSVITLNMRAAAACVNEFIARAFPFRLKSNRGYARTNFLLAECIEEFDAEDSFATTPCRGFARGDVEPLLGIMDLGAGR